MKVVFGKQGHKTLLGKIWCAVFQGVLESEHPNPFDTLSRDKLLLPRFVLTAQNDQQHRATSFTTSAIAAFQCLSSFMTLVFVRHFADMTFLSPLTKLVKTLSKHGYIHQSWKHCGDPHVLDRWCESYWCPGEVDGNIGYHCKLYHPIHFANQKGTPFLQLCFDKNNGCRIGEASNPGPPNPRRCKVKIAIVNPTSVRDKKEEFHTLISKHGCNIIGLSETSATKQTQKEVTHQLRQLHCKALWSPPVPPQRIRLDGDASKRGRAGGTAVFSSFPARLSRIPEKEIGHLTNRIVHSVIQIGGTSIQILVIYGVTASNSNALATTEELIQEAISRSKRLHIPAIFMGDFNMPIDQAQAFQPLFYQGYRHLKELYQTKYGQPMPPTCNEVTHPDTAVIHPLLIPLIEKIEVNKDKMFDTHDPVFVTLTLPENQLFVTRYAIPRSWADLNINKEDLQKAFEIDRHSNPQNLEQWCKKCENLVDLALKMTHEKNASLQPVPCLPKSFRGRGFDNKPKKFPAQAQVKLGRTGDYEPQEEISSFKVKRQVTQLRRVQSLCRRMQKLENTDDIWENTKIGIQQEWKKICSSTCMGGSFWMWAQHQPEIGPLTTQVPSSHKLNDLFQILKFYVDDAVYRDRKIQKNLAKWGKIEDQTANHSKQAFAIARGMSKPPLNRIATSHSEEALIVGDTWIEDETGDHVMELAVNNPDNFNINFPIEIHEHLWWIKEKSTFSLVVAAKKPPEKLENSCHLSHKVEHVDPQFIFQELDSYWHQFWSRDPIDDTLSTEDEENFQKIFSKLPAEIGTEPLTDTNVEDWIEAINSTKSHSAPGVDGIRASELKMLPREMIEILVKIMSSNPGLLPIKALTGRTIPLPKSWEVEHVGRTRPITILPQLYRIWGKVISTQAIRQLSARLPPPISGFLKGRSAFQSAYDTQCWLEHTAKAGLDKSGVTLDLMKCYNLIRRYFAKAVLRVFNIGEDIINKWQNCMQHLVRFWEIDGQISQPCQTTTGCAEGDPIAVVIMIGIATCWVYQTPFDQNDLRINAFADNWSWASLNAEHHHTMTQATQDICNVARLQVDPQKTWMWATSPGHEREVKLAMENIVGANVEITKVAGARDLGLYMQYTGSAKLGTLKDRLQEGLQRLKRIKFQDWDLPVKLHVIKSSVYPAAFHGSEQTAIGTDHLQKFRHQVAEAILQTRSRTMTAVLTFQGLPMGLWDPGLFVILSAFKTARKWLLKQTPENRKAFCQMVTKHRGQTGTTQGPASTLKCYMLRLGWVMSESGSIQVGSNIWINLYTCTQRELEFWGQKAWQEKLLVQHTQRFSMFSFPDTDKIATSAVIKKFSAKHQRMILHEISQSFQAGHQKGKWLEGEASLCPWCKQPDDKEHRYLHCPAMQSIRDSHPFAIRTLEEDFPIWCQLPIIFVPPFRDFIDALHYNMPEVPIPNEVAQWVMELHGPRKVNIYTDGSCQHPTHPSTCYAAFAIVADLAESDTERKKLAERYQATGIEPETLEVISKGRLPKRQDINRAETLAVTLTCEAFQDCHIFVDSAAAINAFQKSRTMGNSADNFDHAQYDLVVRLQQAKAEGQTVQKIKAHVDLTRGNDLLAVYHGLGNKRANDEAICTALHSIPQLHKEFEDFHQGVAQESKKLTQVYEYIIDLQTARARAEPTCDHQEANNLPVPRRDPFTLLCQWKPRNVWKPPTRLQCQGLPFGMWGWQASFAALQFLKECEWPFEELGPEGIPIGISWLEIGIAIMLKLGTYLPIQRVGSDGETYLVFLPSLAAAQMHHVTLSELAQVANSLYHQVLNLIPERLTPNIPEGRVKSLYMLGESCQGTGLLLRPAFPDQAKVVELAQQYILSNRQLLDLQLNGCDQWPMDQKKNHLKWDRRNNKARGILRKVKEVRNGPGVS